MPNILSSAETLVEEFVINQLSQYAKANYHKQKLTSTPEIAMQETMGC